MDEFREDDVMQEDAVMQEENVAPEQAIPDSEPEVLQPDEAAARKPRTLGSELLDWGDMILYAVLSIVVVFTFFTRTSTVDGSSMLPTLEDRQNLLITNFFYQPAYNDIVVVWSDLLPNDDGGSGKAIVKRVIGLSGDRISIDFDKGSVSRNGEELAIETKGDLIFEDGHMINALTLTEEGLGGEFTVPEGCIFVMGDNRNGSTDSRSPWVGFVDCRKIIGKAYLRITPLDKFGSLY